MKLSIVTINLNNVSGLEDTLNSVKKQNFNDFEWIVIDGGSMDGSKELIQQNTMYINHWISEKDSGIYNAMNKGSRLATGDYILYLNSGDQLYNECTLSDVFATEHSADIMFGNIVVSDDETVSPRGQKTDQFSIFSFLTCAPIPHPASFFKKDFIESMSYYDESYTIMGDIDLFFRSIFLRNCSLEYLESVITVFDGNGISSGKIDGYDINGESRKLFKKNLPRFIGFDYPEIYRQEDLKKAIFIRNIMMKHKILRHYFYKHAKIS